MRALLALLLCLATPLTAESIVSDLSRDEVSINVTFNGSDILIFGAVRRNAPEPEGEMGVIITVAGPDQDVTVRRKAQKFGIWVNTDQVEIAEAPSFYAVASSGPLEDVLRASEDLRHKITIPQALGQVGTNVLDSRNFSAALLRIREDQSLYQVNEGAVSLSQDTLFSTSVEMPANLTEGAYATQIYLTRDGTVIDSYENVIPVKKVGLERWLYNLSREHAFWYGLMSLAIAIASGWLASAVFTLARR
ncbi:TIGR02186 family protein [Cognatiyoonia sp.]|uniref:TIGR02186 family protein n=1 Tax=Cognatiyoonia sp. TaxID=2211652 RepID=UPI003F6A083C